MPRILVIADDLTGAAEIGGIAVRFGLSTQLLRTPSPPPTSCDVVVYDTDSRLLPAVAAAEKTAAFAQVAQAGAFDLVFKKTDSALRGEPFAELEAVAWQFNRADVLFLPHNPSRDRCIISGRYTVGGVPLHQTEFGQDPLHPAQSDDVIALLRATGDIFPRCVATYDQDSAGWVIGEASTPHDVAAWAERFDPGRQLAAGGADFFDAIVQRFKRTKPVAAANETRRPLLYVSGTASAGSKALKQSLESNGRLIAMPAEVFARGETESEAMNAWAAAAATVLANGGEAMVAIGRTAGRDDAKAKQLQYAIGAVAERVLAIADVRTIACEGGATAATLCDRLGWQQFAIEAEVAPGIVRLRSTAAAPTLIVKPGSYPWPRV